MSTAAQLSAALASVAQFFNITGSAYDPSRVVALVDTSNVNAGKQTLHGFDMLARYSIAISPGNRIAVTANGSYLLSRQQLTLLQPVQPLSGQLFNPPRFRARGTMTWTRHALTSSATLSYIGGVSDPRSSPPVRIHGMTTLDLTERYAFATEQGLLKGLELEVSAQNLFNAKPAVIATTAVTDTPYDSTNYSPLGRVLAVRITKRW